MKTVFQNEVVNFFRYRVRVVQLGTLVANENAGSKQYGTHKFIELQDLDSNENITLYNVIVYVECASLLREGADISIIHAKSAVDDTELSAIVAAKNTASARNDYPHFFSEVTAKSIATTAEYKTVLFKMLYMSFGAFFLGLVLIIFIIPTLALWPGALLLLYARRKFKRQMKEMQRVVALIPSPDEFSEKIANHLNA